jgi:YVTN family beta-propeller protein
MLKDIIYRLKRVTWKESLEKHPQIMVGRGPADIAINQHTNKIYVANYESGTVSVIDSDSGNIKSIRVGSNPVSIAIDDSSGKIYVANAGSNSVSVIDGYNDTKIKDIRVGEHPATVLWGGYFHPKIYVANLFSKSISVINTVNDTKEKKDITVGRSPVFMAVDINVNKIYVANRDNNTVSVIYEVNDTKEKKDITVGRSPVFITIYSTSSYVANQDNNTVSVIDDGTDKIIQNITIGVNPNFLAIRPPNQTPRDYAMKIYVVNNCCLGPENAISVVNGSTIDKVHNITVGEDPEFIAGVTYPIDRFSFYVANFESNTVSVINSTTDTKEYDDIPVGIEPRLIASDSFRHMIYVVNHGYEFVPPVQGTVSVIDASSNKVQAGVIFKINPANSGKIICNERQYPTNTYLYLDPGTYCTAQANNGFLFNTWVVSPPTNRNSSIPLESTGNLTIDRYGTFTVNFKPTIPPEYLFLIISVVITTVMGWSIPSIAGWIKARRQLEHLKDCLDQIDKLDRNTIEDKINGYYVLGKIREEHRQFLKDKVSEYYGSVKDSEGYGAPF